MAQILVAIDKSKNNEGVKRHLPRASMQCGKATCSVLCKRIQACILHAGDAPLCFPLLVVGIRLAGCSCNFLSLDGSPMLSLSCTLLCLCYAAQAGKLLPACSGSAGSLACAFLPY